jgi:hypothetical protein
MNQDGRFQIALVVGYLHYDLACLLVVEIHSIGVVADFAAGNIGGETGGEVGFVDCFEFDEAVGFVS